MSTGRLKVITYSDKENNLSHNWVKSMKKYGHDYIVLGKGTKWEGFMTRVRAIRDYIKTIDHEYIVSIDCFDAFAFRNDGNLIETFLSFNADIVVSAEKICLYFLNCVPIPKWSKLAPYRYVNAGFYMGRREKVIEMLTWLLDSGMDDDQYALGKYILTEPNIKIELDYQRKLCNTETVCLLNDQRINKVNSYFVHIPGSYGDFYYRYLKYGNHVLREAFEPPESILHKVNIYVSVVFLLIIAVMFCYFSDRWKAYLIASLLIIALILYVIL